MVPRAGYGYTRKHIANGPGASGTNSPDIIAGNGTSCGRVHVNGKYTGPCSGGRDKYVGSGSTGAGCCSDYIAATRSTYIHSAGSSCNNSVENSCSHSS